MSGNFFFVRWCLFEKVMNVLNFRSTTLCSEEIYCLSDFCSCVCFVGGVQCGLFVSDLVLPCKGTFPSLLQSRKPRCTPARFCCEVRPRM